MVKTKENMKNVLYVRHFLNYEKKDILNKCQIRKDQAIRVKLSD